MLMFNEKKMKAPSRKSSSAIATTLVAIGILGEVDMAAGEFSTVYKTLCNMGFGTCAPEEPFPPSTSTPATAEPNPNCEDPTATAAADKNEEYLDHCHIWPPAGAPPEHRDDACDRAWQNAVWASDDAEANAAPPEDLIPDTTYLNLPEEKTWICPSDAVVGEGAGTRGNDYSINPGGVDGSVGHPTRWIVHNEATSPIVLAHVNALGLEVSAADFGTYPAHADTAVHPNGPIVLPGQMAVVDGRQGQSFVAREYREVLPMHAMVNLEGDLGHSWKSFKSVLPQTLSFLPEQTRYTTNKGVIHVLGHPGRVLMKHRMGNIYVKNQFGAFCPESIGGASGSDSGEDCRTGSPKDLDPDCNVLRKAFINKAGCPVDIYFAPQNKKEGYNCEKFTKHLGPLETFLSSDQQTRDIDAYDSPLKFENTYNGHSFVARMSHDQSLVARIDVDHDVVRDCPEPARNGVGVEVQVDERMPQGVQVDAMLVNATKFDVHVNTTVTATSVLLGKPEKEKHNVLWQNRTDILAASLPITS